MRRRLLPVVARWSGLWISDLTATAPMTAHSHGNRPLWPPVPFRHQLWPPQWPEGTVYHPSVRCSKCHPPRYKRNIFLQDCVSAIVETPAAKSSSNGWPSGQTIPVRLCRLRQPMPHWNLRWKLLSNTARESTAPCSGSSADKAVKSLNWMIPSPIHAATGLWYGGLPRIPVQYRFVSAAQEDIHCAQSFGNPVHLLNPYTDSRKYRSRLPMPRLTNVSLLVVKSLLEDHQ